MTTNRFFGDSMTVGANNGVGSTDPILPMWPYIVTPWPHLLLDVPDVRANSGFTLTDQASSIYAYTPVTASRHFHLAGKADQIGYGSGATAISQFQKSLAAFTYWLAGTKNLANSLSWTYTGTWNVTSFYGSIGKFTQANGATANFSISGDVLAFQQVVSDLNTATITVKCDGIVVGTFPCIGDHTLFRGGSTPIYAPVLRRISGLGAGAHTIQIIANVQASPTANDLVMLDWNWIGTNALPLLLLTNPKSTHSDDTAVAAYNSAVSAVASQAFVDGLNVTLIDAGAAIDPLKSLTSDGYHFSNIGHLDYARAVKALGGL